MKRLTFEDGIIRLEDQDIPGILKTLSVRGQVKYDETKMDAQSGQARIPAGWKDADIAVTVELLTDLTTCYQKLKLLNAIFKGAESSRDTDHGQTISRPPKIYTVVNQHINARGIRKVVFSGLASNESDMDDVIQAVLTFDESNNPAADAEKRAQGTDSTSTDSGGSDSISKDDEKLTGQI
jgi:hypothetical protein